MTEGEAAPAAASGSDKRNLAMRIAVAAVLIPLAVAIAYAGGWLWTALVTLAAIGLFAEWLAIVGLSGAMRVTVPGVAALAVAGLCLAVHRLDATAMALGARQAARCRPAPVSVHDDRHMQRNGSIRSFRGRGGGVRHHQNSRASLDRSSLNA